MNALSAADLAFNKQAAFFATVTRFEQVAVYTVMVYDWLLCWDHELDLLSAPGISPAKVAYLLARYWPLLTHPITIWTQVVVTDPSLCAKIFQIPLFFTIGNFFGAASVLIVRLYAFSGALISVAVGLVGCLLGVAIFQVWVVATQIQLVPHAPGCFPMDKPSVDTALSGYFLSPFLFDMIATALFALFVAGVRVKVSASSSPIRVFVREGAFYFVAISAVNLANAVMNFQPQIDITGTVVPFSMLLPNILACRLVINLRSAVSDPVHGATNATTGIGFTSAPPRPRSSITLTEVGIPFQRTPTDFGTPVRAEHKVDPARTAVETTAALTTGKPAVQGEQKVASLAVKHVEAARPGHAKSSSQETAASASSSSAPVVQPGAVLRSRSRSRGRKDSMKSPDGWASREHIELMRSPTGRTYI